MQAGSRVRRKQATVVAERPRLTPEHSRNIDVAEHNMMMLLVDANGS